MRGEIVDKLVAINRKFYHDFAPAFSLSRAYPWKGFPRLSDALPTLCTDFLDVGCGDGRLGRYLLDNGRIQTYTGVDYSTELLTIAQTYTDQPAAKFYVRNLIQPHFLDGLGQFDGIACMATLHHIPSVQKRIDVLRELGDHLTEGGRLIFTTFQFMDSPRQRRKVADWSEVGIDPADVEPTDYLVSFESHIRGVRHINLIDEAAVDHILSHTDLTLIDRWRSDGKEGNLNLYSVVARS